MLSQSPQNACYCENEAEQCPWKYWHYKHSDAVGKPVARLPPHRSLREVFPHKAPRLGSLPCQAMWLPDVLFPAVRLARVLRSCVSGTSFLCELRPPVPPFPMSWSFSTSEYYGDIRHLGAYAFPVRVLRLRSRVRIRDNLRGFPGSMMHLFVHATAYGELRRSFTSLHSRVASALVRALITDALVLGSARVKVLPDRKGISELYQLSGTHGVPYGLHDALCTLRHACSMRVL